MKKEKNIKEVIDRAIEFNKDQEKKKEFLQTPVIKIIMNTFKVLNEILEELLKTNKLTIKKIKNNLIKKFKPKYNILLRDNKSFPFIFISNKNKWPQITKHRGKKTDEGHYFGPFASAGAANWTIKMLQKIFLLRVCNDTIFKNRTRPCLLYDIKRCSAPCV